MTNPPYILNHLNSIAEILNHSNVYSFLHVPVQSGSDAVLGAMRREYNTDDFCKVIDTLREQVHDVNIATGKYFSKNKFWAFKNISTNYDKKYCKNSISS